MAGVVLRSEYVSAKDPWTQAINKGIDGGLGEATEAVQESAEASLAARKDPWGEAFAPRAPLTIKLRAVEVEDKGTLAGGFVVKKRSGRKYTLTMRGKRYIAGQIMQFGSESKHVFDNARTVTQPARPFMPITQAGAVDLPPELAAAISQLIDRAVSGALVKEGVADSQRIRRTLRSRR